MAMTEGWRHLVSHINGKYIPGHQATLERGNFNDLLAVGRAQGAIAELKKVIAFVEKCQEKIKNEE